MLQDKCEHEWLEQRLFGSPEPFQIKCRLCGENREPESFAEAPTSIAEHKAISTGQGAGLWQPRDVLIAALRDIDSGNSKPHTLIIAMAEDTDTGTTAVRSMQSMPSTFYGVGILQAIINGFIGSYS